MRINIWVLVATIVLAVMPAGVHAQSDDGLVAEWHFDEGSGSVLKDSSGNGNDGVIHGATWTEGNFGSALEFDGVDDYVEVPDSPSLDITDVITVELWVNPTTLGDWDLMVHKINAYGIGYSFVDHPGFPGDRNKFEFHKFQTNPPDYCKCSNSVNSPIPGNWYHIIGTFDGTQHKIYVNGNLEGTVSYTGTFSTTDYPLIFGGYFYHILPTHPQEYLQKYLFNGIIDEVRIYNRALTAEEIKEHYEQEPTALSITKTATPNSIKQGQTTTITLTVKNTGSTEISDIEIADTIPSYLTFIDGETSKRYDSLAPKDTRQISYTLQFNDAGTFNFEPAIATYADDKGNYNTVKSKPASIEVIRSIIENSAPTPKPMNGNVQSASVNLHGEKTDVALGEDVLLKLSAVNIIGNPTMHVQVIIIPPSGWSVTSSEFAKSGAGQYTTTYELESGGGKDIEVRIVPNQIGDDFQVEGRIIYYFGDDLTTREDHTLSLPIKVRAESDDGQKPSTDSEASKTPGFGVLVAVIGLLMTAHLIKRK